MCGSMINNVLRKEYEACIPERLWEGVFSESCKLHLAW